MELTTAVERTIRFVGKQDKIKMNLDFSRPSDTSNSHCDYSSSK